MLQAYGATDKGPARGTNEDCFALDLDLRLCIIADGMGGHNAGEVAASVAVESILACVRAGADGDSWPHGYDESLSRAGNLLARAIHAANQEIFQLASRTPEYDGMGTTIVAILEREGVLSVAHAGDSRAYLVAGAEIHQLTEDDTWVAAVLSRDPAADPAALKQHPMRNALTNVVGARPAAAVHVSERRLAGGERVVLTTDGVHGVLDQPTIASLTQRSDAQEGAASLIRAALEAGSRDNCTAVVAEFVPE